MIGHALLSSPRQTLSHSTLKFIFRFSIPFWPALEGLLVEKSSQMRNNMYYKSASIAIQGEISCWSALPP